MLFPKFLSVDRNDEETLMASHLIWCNGISFWLIECDAFRDGKKPKFNKSWFSLINGDLWLLFWTIWRIFWKWNPRDMLVQTIQNQKGKFWQLWFDTFPEMCAFQKLRHRFITDKNLSGCPSSPKKWKSENLARKLSRKLPSSVFFHL